MKALFLREKLNSINFDFWFQDFTSHCSFFSVCFKNYSKFIYPKFIGYFEIFLYFNFSSDDFESQNKDFKPKDFLSNII